MTKRGHYRITCPTCNSAPLALVVTTGWDHGQLWEDVEIADDEPRACGCEPEDAALEVAVEESRRAA